MDSALIFLIPGMILYDVLVSELGIIVHKIVVMECHL